MTQGIKAVAFDLDGTLIDSGKGLAEGIDQMLESLGYAPAGLAQVSVWIGHGAEHLVKTALNFAGGAPALAKFDEAIKIFNTCYTEILKQGSTLYPDVRETLETLQKEGFRLALITNKPTKFLPALLNDLGMNTMFEWVLGADDVAARKPHPAPIFQTLGALGLTQAEMIFVGDSRNDIACARDAGVKTIGLTYGYNFGHPISDENPTYILDHFQDLLPIVRGTLA